MATLGKRIRAVRGSRSQNVFAHFLGISKGTLVSYEHDKSSPNAKILMTICVLERIEIKWLLTGEGAKYQGGVEERADDVPPRDSDGPPIQLPGCPHCMWMEKLIDKMEEDRRHLLLENKKLLIDNTVLHNKVHPNGF
ncbi:helix-turn-helix transcriptional regulator [Desulfovibrio sp. ZJ200]|uniref:helix-turn-helix domain-containing protein n=1 Tax=Desulfovibrio sp. ZJ200 TaxID=2709792 RepID=UPI0013E9E809|nr:helix-turn-helix transcriptional regulator [Desulfovibrio sp. ZJ200]